MKNLKKIGIIFKMIGIMLAVVAVVFLISLIIIFVMYLLFALDKIDLNEYAYAENKSYVAINPTIADNNIKEMIALTDKEAWKKLTGKEISGTRPTSKEVQEDDIEKRMTEITIPIRTENGNSSITVQVNKELATLFNAFFNDLYDNCPDFYIKTCKGYHYITIKDDLLSAHSIGAALDINAEYNTRGKAPLSLNSFDSYNSDDKNYKIYENSPMVNIAKVYGLCWGGNFASKDPMHFSYIGDWTRAKINSTQGY